VLGGQRREQRVRGEPGVVRKYAEGIEDWTGAGLPTDSA
jgi:hypothetical protein